MIGLSCSEVILTVHETGHALERLIKLGTLDSLPERSFVDIKVGCCFSLATGLVFVLHEVEDCL